MLRITILFLFLGLCNACTEFILRAKDGAITVGRTWDWDVQADWGFEIEPTGTKHRSYLNQVSEECQRKAARWESRYKVIIVKPQKEPLDYMNGDGINDQGLSVSAFYFKDVAHYEDGCHSNCRDIISQMEFVGFVLANFRDVNDLRRAFSSNRFPCVMGNLEMGSKMVPFHYAVTDRNGHAIVIEYTRYGRRIYDNNIRVIANSPAYDWHLTNIKYNYHYDRKDKYEREYYDASGNKHHFQNSDHPGLMGVPGDFTSPSRFMRAAAMVHMSDIPRDAVKATLLSFHIMGNLALPRGIEPGSEFPHWTFWELSKDLKMRCMYFRTYDNVLMRRLCIDDVPNEYGFYPLDKRDEDFDNSYEDISNKVKVQRSERSHRREKRYSENYHGHSDYRNEHYDHSDYQHGRDQGEFHGDQRRDEFGGDQRGEFHGDQRRDEFQGDQRGEFHGDQRRDEFQGDQRGEFHGEHRGEFHRDSKDYDGRRNEFDGQRGGDYQGDYQHGRDHGDYQHGRDHGDYQGDRKDYDGRRDEYDGQRGGDYQGDHQGDYQHGRDQGDHHHGRDQGDYHGDL